MTCKVTEMRLSKLFHTHKHLLIPNTTDPKNLISFKGLNNPQFISSLHSSSHRLYPQNSNFALNSSIPEIPTSQNSPDWESRGEKGSKAGFNSDTSRPGDSVNGNAVDNVNRGNDSEKSKDGDFVHNPWSLRYGVGELGDRKGSGGVKNTGGGRGYGEGFTAGNVGFKKKGKSKGCWVCSDCGHTEGQWWGACRVCKQVGTMKQFKVVENGTSGGGSSKVTGFEVSENSVRSWLPPSAGEVQPQRLRDISMGLNQLEWRIPLHGSFGEEVSRVLGGGLVPGSLVLVGGDPGVGKSTLILQIAAMIAEGYDIGRPAPVVYVSGEESVEQIGSRADRLNIVTEELYLYSSTDIEDILDKIQALSPRTLIVDSIQTVYLRGVTGSAGGLSQVKECTSALLRFAKKTNVPVILIGHVTKSGDIAGPRVLEHIVDVVLYLEGEKSSSHRLLRSVKNRFGSTDELGVFEMTQLGLEAVVNPSEIYLSQEEQSDSEVLAGLAIAVIMDSSRTFLIEIQSGMLKYRNEFYLYSPSSASASEESKAKMILWNDSWQKYFKRTWSTSFGLSLKSFSDREALCVSASTVSTSRHVNGIQASRADMIISVLVKQAGLKLQENAIFLNVVSGVSLTETAGDLAIAAAICSSFLEFPIPSGIAFIGEIGLAGELRTVPGIEKRVSTVAKLGYKTCIVPKSAEKALASLDFQDMAIISCKNLKEVINAVFTT